MIDYELLNNLMALGFAVGVAILIVIICVGGLSLIYLCNKILKQDDDAFKSRVKSIIKEFEKKK